MIHRYTALVYAPSPFDRLHLVPQRRVKWGKVFSDIKTAWNWLKEKVSPTPNPFDLALQEVFSEFLFEGI